MTSVDRGADRPHRPKAMNTTDRRVAGKTASDRRNASADPLGDRMKAYEAHETHRRFLPGLPIYARIDGRNFTAFTEGMRRPFDPRMVRAMVETAIRLVEETNAAIGYAQSDEISLVWHPQGEEAFFSGKIQKTVSVLASFATAAFTRALLATEDPTFAAFADRAPHFDARAIQMPSRVEAANMILWRTMDATKNAVSMAARQHFPHARLQGLASSEMQELLFREAGVNFNDYPAAFKRGAFVRRETVVRPFTAEELDRIPPAHRPPEGTTVERSAVREIAMPVFSKVTNRVPVVFERAAPETAEGKPSEG